MRLKLPGYALGINDHHVIVGYGSTVGNEVVRGFAWRPRTGLVDLGAPGRESYASGVSRDGLVVGNNYSADGQGLRGFAWTYAGGMVDLGPFGSTYSQVGGVTTNGIVFGLSYDPGGAGHATIWQASATRP